MFWRKRTEEPTQHNSASTYTQFVEGYKKYVEPFNSGIRTIGNVSAAYAFMQVNYGRISALARAGQCVHQCVPIGSTAAATAATTAGTVSATTVALSVVGVGVVCGGAYYGYTKYRERQMEEEEIQRRNELAQQIKYDQMVNRMIDLTNAGSEFM